MKITCFKSPAPLRLAVYGAILTACLLAAGPAAAQLSASQQRQVDSLRTQLQKDSAHIFRFQMVRPFLGIDTRNSWIKNENGTKNVPINVNGFQLGVILHEDHTVGLGFYSIANSSKLPHKLTDRNNRTRYQNLKLSYATLFYQYTIVDTRFFELDVPMEIGIGKYDYYLSDSVQVKLPKTVETGPMRLTGGGVNIVLKPVRWIGLNGMAGYRFCVFNKHTALNLNGLYYSYGVWIDVRQIIRDTRYYLVKKRRYRHQVLAIMGSN